MLLRLILALMLAAFAAPGMASGCDDAAVPMSISMDTTAHAAMTHHGSGRHHDRTAVHSCIGCIPPSSWRAASVLHAPLVPPLPRAIVIDAYVAGRASPPALPPPRIG